MRWQVLFFSYSSWVAISASAHPLPDVPVGVDFDATGHMTIKVEIDPRCWAADPNTAPYTTKAVLEQQSQIDREALLAKAKDFASKSVEIVTEPPGLLAANLTFALTTVTDRPLEKADDPVVATGTWRGPVPQGLRGLGFRAPKPATMAVVVHHYYQGRGLERFAVLFPGETSFLIDPAQVASMPLAVEPAAAPDGEAEPVADAGVSAAAPSGTSVAPKLPWIRIAVAGGGVLLALAAWMRSRRPAA